MNSTTRKISECAEVLPGFALKVRAEHEPEGSHFILMAKDLKEMTTISFSEEQGDVLRMNIDKPTEKYRLHKDDILFISRGARNEAAVIGAVPENTVASSVFYILRPRQGVMAGYLAWCINLLNNLGRLDQIRTGAGTPIIQRQNLKEMAIPLPSLNEQQQIAQMAQVMTEQLKLQESLLENTRSLHKIINTKLLMEQLKYN